MIECGGHSELFHGCPECEIERLNAELHFALKQNDTHIALELSVAHDALGCSIDPVWSGVCIHGTKCCRAAHTSTLQNKIDTLREALDSITPREGFPKCDRICSSINPGPNDYPMCDCGWEQIREEAARCRAILKDIY
jgi:hypothetical protein